MDGDAEEQVKRKNNDDVQTEDVTLNVKFNKYVCIQIPPTEACSLMTLSVLSRKKMTNPTMLWSMWFRFESVLVVFGMLVVV